MNEQQAHLFRVRMYTLVAVILLNLAFIQFNMLRMLYTRPTWPDCDHYAQVGKTPIEITIATQPTNTKALVYAPVYVCSEGR